MKNSVRRLFYAAGSLGVIIPLVVGLPFFLFGISEFYKTYRIVQTSLTVEGVVVDNDLVHRGEGSTYVPVVRFTTSDGEVVRFSDGIGSYPPEYEEGETVNVLYNPEDVHDARIHTGFRLWFLPTLLTVVGLLPIGIGLGIMLLGAGSIFFRRRMLEKHSK